MTSVLFLMRNPTHAGNFEPLLRALARRGIDTTVAFEERKPGDDHAGLELVEQLCAECGGVHHDAVLPLPRGPRAAARLALEAVQDYLWYFEPPFDRATKLRARIFPRLPPRAERAVAAALAVVPGTRRALAAIARSVAARMGPDSRALEQLRRRRPDLVIVSPLVHPRSRQNDWVLAAHELGIATMLCIHGWDDLTSKGRIHPPLDRIAVWNEAQCEQAIAHGAARDRIRVVGAWPYDHWLEWQPSRSRDELCRQLGLPDGRALILYACSSRFIAPREVPAVAEWIAALRACDDPRVAEANVIIRPRLSTDGWADRPLNGLPGVSVFPSHGVDPVDDATRSDYFDSIVLADAVVGVNTSALLESAILDRRALAFPPPRFRSTQEALPHFRQLLPPDGAVEVSRSMAEHLGQLSHALAQPGAGAADRRRFVTRFIHAGPPDPPAAERLASVVEEVLDSSAARRGAARTAAVR